MKRGRSEALVPNVCMFGTGEYTTGFVGTGAADSDKGTGVVALVMLFASSACALRVVHAGPHRRSGITRMVDDAEIAALEEKLAALKEAKEAEAVAAPEVDGAEAAVSVEVAEGFDFSTMSSRKKVAASQSATPSELLSEAWKEEDEAGEGGLPLVQVGGALVALVLLVALAQAPVGGDNLDLATFGGKEVRYESAAEIKARYEQLQGGDEDD